MPDIAGTVEAVCVGSVGEIGSGSRKIVSAFIKTPVRGRVAVGPLGLPGDEHVYKDHGGPDFALLAYPRSTTPTGADSASNFQTPARWARTSQPSASSRPRCASATCSRPGPGVIQVTEPRSPCRKLAARFGRADMAAMVQDTGFTGFLCRVLVCGDIGAGDALRMLRRDDQHDMTVAEAGRILNTDRGDLAGARRLYAVPALGYSARRRLAARLA